jgi:uncharacterized protein (TIGR00369 family)
MTLGTDRMVRGEHVRSPASESLGLPLIAGYGSGRVWYEWQLDSRFIYAGGVLFGGYICALIDDVGGYASQTILSDDSMSVTSDIQVSLFRPAKVEDGWLRMDAEVVNASRRAHRVDARLTRKSDGRLIARGTIIMSVVARS